MIVSKECDEIYETVNRWADFFFLHQVCIYRLRVCSTTKRSDTWHIVKYVTHYVVYTE